MELKGDGGRWRKLVAAGVIKREVEGVEESWRESWMKLKGVGGNWRALEVD